MCCHFSRPCCYSHSSSKGWRCSRSLFASRGFSAVFTVLLTAIKRSWLENVAFGEKLCCRFCLFKIRVACRSPPLSGLHRAPCQLPCCCQGFAHKPFSLGPWLLSAGRTAVCIAVDEWQACAYAATKPIFILSLSCYCSLWQLELSTHQSFMFSEILVEHVPPGGSRLLSTDFSSFLFRDTAASAGQLGKLHFEREFSVFYENMLMI